MKTLIESIESVPPLKGGAPFASALPGLPTYTSHYHCASGCTHAVGDMADESVDGQTDGHTKITIKNKG